MSDVTFTAIVQVESAAIVPFVSVKDVPPGAALSEAEFPQPVRVGETGSARKTFAGRLSVIAAWVRLALVRLFRMTTDNRLVWPAQIVLGLKFLVTEGMGLPVTFKVALAGLVLLMVVPPPVALRAPAGMVLIRLPVTKDVTFT
jgi:hypothetical protein